jgi:hypothetical protein
MTALILLTVTLVLAATAVGLVIVRQKDAGATLVALVVMMIAAIVAVVYGAVSSE